MHASTLRHAADTVGERVSTVADVVGDKVSTVADVLGDKVGSVAHTVAEKAPEVTHKVGGTAHRLAAKTPWVEEPKPPTHALRTWTVRMAMLAVAGAIALWFVMRRRHEPYADSELDTTEAPVMEDHRRFAAVGT